MRFIHTADIHLDSPLHRLEAYEGAPVDEIRQASRRAFENLVDLAIGEAVDFVLIAGDLFDGDWKDYNTGLYFTGQTRRLRENGIQVFIISGNHDAAGRMTRALPYPDNVHLFSYRKPETHILDDLKVAIHGQSYPKASVTENLATGYPEPLSGFFNIGLLHTSLNGRPGHENYAPCALDDLINKGYDYWALGHVHQFEVVSETPFIVFPGCIQGRHIKEAGAKGCALISGGEGEAIDVSHFDLDVIRWEKVAVGLGGAMDIEACLERFKSFVAPLIDVHDPKPLIVRAEFSGETHLHEWIASDPEAFKETIRSFAIARFGDRLWVEKVRVKTRPKTISTPNTGPLRELDILVGALTKNDDDLLTLGRELDSLFQKLPSEYRLGVTRLDPKDPLHLKVLVEQAHALVLRQLKKGVAAK
jgi:exonuclease SbcD